MPFIGLVIRAWQIIVVMAASKIGYKTNDNHNERIQL